VPVLAVDDLAQLIGPVAARFYGDPSRRMRMIGVTGTNGKTSCSHWVAQLLSAGGEPCAVLGTLGGGFPGALRTEVLLTTPDAVNLQREVRRLLDAGARALAMEVSSIGLEQGRVDAMAYDIALFTNLTRDHLDYHGTMQAYGAAKARLFDWPTLSHAVLNLDDPFGRELARRCAARGVAVIGYRTGAEGAGVPLAVELRAEAVELRADGIRFDVRLARDGHAAETAAAEAPLIGAFNVSNLLGVLGVALACGMAPAAAAGCLKRLQAPPGRMQSVGAVEGAPLALVDYAHTPDAIEKALIALRPLARARGGRLWIVFGAGGDRDPGKRPEMGRAAARLADHVVLTSDNPRFEDPESIIDQIAAGTGDGPGPERDADRARAIDGAIARAAARDVVLIAGKGHEDYQEVAGRRLPFSDFARAAAAVQARGREQRR
jgi:UDP-N-acetylmuramoyl-L-alanyl-D-glutamate--2,6-diaminopimelate ligase